MGNIEHCYIHIPFCIRKCRYCSFVSGVDISFKEKYLVSLENEIKSRYKSDKLKTLYFGGGTPALLSPDDIQNIISLFDISACEEITLETNPETVTKEKFDLFKQTGINRISLGIQTFDEDILRFIGRNHCEKDIYNALDIIKNSGFENISTDFIYGLPGQTSEILKNDIQKAVKTGIKHISTYGLKIDEGSYFYRNKPQNLPDDEQQAMMYEFLCKFMKENEFEHYEISNFAKKEFYSRHNLAYWKNKNYYGFGLNASGYEGNIRYKNTSDMNIYLNSENKTETIQELTRNEIEEEEIFLALRLKEGIDISDFNQKFNDAFEEKYKKIISKYKKFGLLKNENGRCFLTEEGFLLSNEVMSEFISD